jgi:enoyl-CoA hydratase/carnithine racemase
MSDNDSGRARARQPGRRGLHPQIREQVFAAEDFKEGIRTFVERRQAKFVGR